MNKKKYFSPKSTLLELDSSVLDGENPVIPGNGGTGGNNESVSAKGTSDWGEPEYDDDDGFGW